MTRKVILGARLKMKLYHVVRFFSASMVPHCSVHLPSSKQYASPISLTTEVAGASWAGATTSWGAAPVATASASRAREATVMSSNSMSLRLSSGDSALSARSRFFEGADSSDIVFCPAGFRFNGLDIMPRLAVDKQNCSEVKTNNQAMPARGTSRWNQKQTRNNQALPLDSHWVPNQNRLSTM